MGADGAKHKRPHGRNALMGGDPWLTHGTGRLKRLRNTHRVAPENGYVNAELYWKTRAVKDEPCGFVRHGQQYCRSWDGILTLGSMQAFKDVMSGFGR